MKKIFLGLLILMTLSACHTNRGSYEVGRSPLTSFEVICDDLESMFPGDIWITENYILWKDAFATDKHIFIVDKKNRS